MKMSNLKRFIFIEISLLIAFFNPAFGFLQTGQIELIQFDSKSFFVKSKLDNLYWDISDIQLSDKKLGKIVLTQKDTNQAGLQRADRFIKVIAHPDKKNFVFFQLQQYELVVEIAGGITTLGDPLQLWYKSECNKAQMFKMIPVKNEKNTYYIQNAKSRFYLTANVGHTVTQEAKTEKDNQKWVFEPANPQTEMMPAKLYDSAQPAKNVFFKQMVYSGKYKLFPCKGSKTNKNNIVFAIWDLED